MGKSIYERSCDSLYKSAHFFAENKNGERSMIHEIYLTGRKLEMVKQHCKGCQIFDPTQNVTNICSVMRIYVDYVNKRIEWSEFIEYIKGCPCNQKCIVKAACRRGGCPEWDAYVAKIIDKKLFKYMKEK